MRMPKSEKTYKDSIVEPIDLSSIEAKPLAVAIDGKELPLMIGSKVEIEHENATTRTVVGIKIDVEGKATYCLEWFNGTDFKYDWVSARELRYVHMNLKKRGRVSLV